MMTTTETKERPILFSDPIFRAILAAARREERLRVALEQVTDQAEAMVIMFYAHGNYDEQSVPMFIQKAREALAEKGETPCS